MAPALTKHIHVEHVMGTAVTVDVRGRRPAPETIAAALEWLHEVEAEFSPYRPGSAVCRIDRGELTPGEASAHMQWVIVAVSDFAMSPAATSTRP